jgi:hypothetical protein
VTRDRRSGGPWGGLAPILAVAFGIRLAWVLAAPVDPREAFLWDMTFYDLAALQVADGVLLRDLDGVATARWTPGYPLLLGGTYAIFGTGLLMGKLLNVVLATLSVACTGLLGARLFGRTTGLAASAVLALLPGYVLYAPLLLSETAFVTLFSATLLLFVHLDARRPERLVPRWLGFGALLGAAILVRGAALLFLAIPALVSWRTTRSPRVAMQRAAVAALGLAAVIAPWTLRNALVLGAPVLLSTQQMGMALTFAHSDFADGGMSMRMAALRDARLAGFRDLPQPQREVAENRAEVRRAVRYMLSHPLRELSLVPHRWRRLFAHDHEALTWGAPRGPRGEIVGPVISDVWDRRAAGLADAAFYAVALLALAGLPACFDSRRPARLLLPGSVLYTLILHGLLFAGDARFHAPLYPILAILASVGGLSLWRAGRARLGRHST